MHRPLLHGLLLAPFLLAPRLAAQGTEAEFMRKQAVELHKFARAAFDQGQPGQARRVWQEILQLYDPDHAAAREALGFKRSGGGGWFEDADHSYPLVENPDRRALQTVDKLWKATAKKVGGAHRAQAQRFQAAGRTDRATFHFQRALRFLPDDAALQAASGLKTFYGLAGTELEQQLYDQSRRMQDLVAAQRKKTYTVEDLPSSQQQKFLTKAGVPHAGYKTEHYTVWSDFEPAIVRELAQNLERCHAFCAEVFGVDKRFHVPELRISTYVFLKGEPLYKKVLESNADLFRPDVLKFLLQHTAMCDMGKGADKVQISGDPFEPVVLDLSIRWPAESWSSMRCDALREGVGHAVVAMFLGHIEVFSLDVEKQEHTVTRKTGPRQVLIPDVDSWTDLAIESAFRTKGTPLAGVPLLTADKFTGDDRVRAWSYSDYILRRDPRLLLELDATRSAKGPQDVRAGFRQKTGIEVELVEKEWRDFWTGATPVLRALRGKKAPLDVASRDATKWLAEFNRLRQEYKPADRRARQPEPVTWNAAWSVHCKQHAAYLRKHKKERGAAAEQTQRPELEDATPSGQLFAQMALVSTESNPKKAMAGWVDWPGYRDAILDVDLQRVGLFAEGGVAVFDVIRGVVPSRRGGRGGQPREFPLRGAKGVPTGVDLEDLGPEIVAFLAEGKPGKTIGYPISLHGWRGGAMECKVTAGGKAIEGRLHYGSGGSNRRTSAPMMVVFYPYSPLPKGARVQVSFSARPGRSFDWEFSTR